MNRLTLALLSSFVVFAPALAADALAQGPGRGGAPSYDQRYDPRYGPPVRDDRGARGGGYYYGYERYRNIAIDRGFNEGYEAGLKAGRDRRRFDFASNSRFRSGDRGYKKEYGPRDWYRNLYRAGFRQGYERGYQDGMRRYYDRDRRGPGFGIWWGR